MYPKSSFAKKLRGLRVCARKCEYILNFGCWYNRNLLDLILNNTVWCNWWVTVNKETWWVSTNQYVVYMSCQNFFDDLNICVYSVRSLKKQFLWRHSRCWRCKMRTTSWLRSLIIITKARVILWRCNILHLYWKKSHKLQALEHVF